MDQAILRNPERPLPQDSRCSPAPVTAHLVSLGKLDLVERQQNLQVLFDGLPAMEADNFAQADAGRHTGSQFLGSFEIGSPFSTYSRNRGSGSGSSCFIDDAPILVRWVRNAADKALRSFEAFRPHHEDIHRVSYVPHGAPDRHSPLVGVRRRTPTRGE